MSKRSSPAIVCALVVLSAVSALPAQILSKDLVVSGLSRPVLVTAPVGDPRLFIVEQGNSGGLVARIRIFKNGALLGTPFLNVDSLVINSGNERGLLGLAFHPNYEQNGYFYINYNDTSARTVIRRYTVSANPDVANAASGLTLMTINQPYSNHNGGMLAFGPDGHLYIGMGDGGSGNDPGNRAQNVNDLMGKMLRIDVDNPAPGLNYGIPAGNPYAGPTAGRDEILHVGLRNPWRFSFDRDNGDLYIGDVGQNAREEISYAAVGSSPLNFGWRCMEANGCTGLSGCTCFATSLADPVHEYSQGGSTGWCITGGYVYRGCQYPELYGQYFFGDYITDKIWTAEINPAGTALIGVADRTIELSSGVNGLAAFGEDGFGELYIVARDGGTVHRIKATTGGSTLTVFGTPSIGSTINLSLNAPGNPSRAFILGISASTAPGIVLGDGRIIPLTADPLLLYALTTVPNGLYNPVGNLHSLLSNALVPLAIPNTPAIIGAEFWMAYIVLEPTASAGVQIISCPTSILVQ